MKRPRVHFGINLLAAFLFSIVCGGLIPLVNINSDMTKYLPDSSRMKAGMEILTNEFDMSSMPVPEVRVMLPQESATADSAAAAKISAMEGVESVSTQSRDGHTLHELVVAKGIDQKKLAKQIKGEFGEHTVTQTAQDGNTPDAMALIVAMIALVIVLFVLSKSWLEPCLFLFATGMAVVVNIGTNALLPSVSITTTSIVAVLQLVLSMDYSIILMNRYRQQKECSANKREAMTSAIRMATPAILSSSFTTIVGLLMLAFMRLKIGADLGFVLAKGVVCSLFYVYIALPGLVLWLDKWIVKSEKKVPIPGTARLAAFSQKFRIPLTVLFVVIFAGSYYLHLKTPIKFSTNTPSPIDEIFPKKNQIVVLYDNADENAVADVINEASANKEVEAAISYPTLMLSQKTVPEMLDMLKGLSPEGTGMLTEDMLRLIYVTASEDTLNEKKMSFKELTGFLKKQMADSTSMIASFVDSSMKSKLGMLDMLTGASAAPRRSNHSARRSRPATSQVKASSAVADNMQASIPAKPAESITPSASTTETATAPETSEKKVEYKPVTIHDYACLVNAAEPSEESEAFVKLSDTGLLRKSMDASEMSSFMGSTTSQTKMVYSFHRSSEMTPLEFADFLVNDIFKRKALAAMISSDQKAGMKARLEIMEKADNGAILSQTQLEGLAAKLGISTKVNLTPAIDTAPAAAEPTALIAKAESPATAQPAVAAATDTTAAKVSPATAAPAKKTAAVKKHRKTADERKLDIVMGMIRSGRKYTAAEMCRKFASLGEKIDPEQMKMLYRYHTATTSFDPNSTLCLKDMVDCISKDILDNPAFSSRIDDGAREAFASMPERTAMMKGKDHSVAVLITNFKDESPETEQFIDDLLARCDKQLPNDSYLIGESVMFNEMKDGFDDEMRLVTILTVLAIFTIVAITFKSIVVALILVMTVMSAVFINVTACGLGGGSMLYLAYVIVQSILMGATIDYGILFASNYRESGDLAAAYRTSIQTIMTSGLIIILVPGAMALFLNDAMIQPIVRSLSIGAFAAVAMVLFVTPGVLATVKPFRKKDKKKQ